jgi:hypothetical protein
MGSWYEANQLLGLLSHRGCSDVLQRIHDAERQDVRRVVGHDPVNVLGADGVGEIIAQRADLSFDACPRASGHVSLLGLGGA